MKLDQKGREIHPNLAREECVKEFIVKNRLGPVSKVKIDVIMKAFEIGMRRKEYEENKKPIL